GVNDNAQLEVELFNIGTQVNPDRMMRDIQALVSFHTRHVNSSQTSTNRGIGAAREYLLQELRAVQSTNPQYFTVTTQPFEAFFNGIESVQHNVIGILQGTEPGAGTIVVGAHYDSR